MVQSPEEARGLGYRGAPLPRAPTPKSVNWSRDGRRMHYSGVNALDQLAQRYLVQGDETAMEELIRLTRPRLLAAARRIAGASEAEDCVQTAYLSLVHKRGAALTAPVLPWLLTAVVRTAYRRRAQAQRQVEIAGRLRWAGEQESPAQAAGRREDAEHLRSAIDRLPSGLRDVVVLHYIEGLPAKDVAGLIGIREAAVRKRLQRARALLRVSPRVAGAFLSVFWWLGDTAGAALGWGGMVVQNKAAVALATVMLMALVGIWASWSAAESKKRRADASALVLVDGAALEKVEGSGEEEQPPASPDATPAADRPTHVGTVFDTAGQAVGGATVDWFGKDTLGSGTTGANGAYALVAEGARWLRIAAPGYAPLMIRADAARDFYLTKGARLEGRVVGEGVSGLRVLFWSVEARTIYEDEAGRRTLAPWSPQPLGETVTDPDGRFVFEQVPATAFHRVESGIAGRQGPLVGYVRAIGPGVVTEGAEVPARKTGTTIQVTMRSWKAGAVAGRVVDRDGRPVAGLRVYGASQEQRVTRWPMRIYPTLPRPDVITDDAGRYRLDGLHDGNMRMWIRLPGLGTRGPRQEARSHAVAGAVTTVPDIVWTPPVHPVVEATVVDTQGQPLANALVSLTRFRVTVPTDAAGRARLDAWTQRLWDAPAELRVRAEEYVTQRVTNLELDVNRPLAVRITMPRGYTLRGEVVWNDGTPAHGASVTVTDGGIPYENTDAPTQRSAGRPGQGSLGAYGSRFVDEQGRFELRDIAKGPYHVRAHQKGLWSEVITVRGDAPVRIELPHAPPESKSGRIEGTIVDAATDAPILRAPIRFEGRGRTVGKMTAPGRFVVEEVPPGRGKLHVPMPGYLAHESAGIEVAAGATVRLEIRLSRGSLARGQIRGAGANAAVWFLRNDGWNQPAARLGADGTYELTGLRPGVYRVFVFSDTHVATTRPLIVTIEANSAALTRDIQLAPGGMLACRPQNLNAGDDSRLEVRDADGRVWFVVRGPAAKIGRSFPLPPGRYDVRWLEGDRAVAQQTIDLAANARADAPLRAK